MRVIVQALAKGKPPEGLTIDDIKFKIDKSFKEIHDQNLDLNKSPNNLVNSEQKQKPTKKTYILSHKTCTRTKKTNIVSSLT